MELPNWLAERARILNDADIRRTGDFVLYWMHHAVRGHENHALDAALERAIVLDLPVLVYQGLTGAHPHNNDRHYTFILEGARDAARELERRGIRHVFHLARNPNEPSPLPDLLQRAAAAVFEDYPAPPFPDWSRQLAEEAGCRVERVDAACIYPMRLVKERYTRAFQFRRATEKAYQERIRRPYPEKEGAGGAAYRGPLPFVPVDWSNSIPELVAACEIDHTVGPAVDLVGGAVAGYERWDAFRRSGLAQYARRRNDAAQLGGVSRLSPYLHYGHVSSFRVAREAAASGGPGADKFLDELLIWRELAFNFCAFTPRPDTLEAIPEWARETLRAHSEDARPAEFSVEELERGRTGNRLWDLAQQSLVRHGELHNNLRMTWGKALLEWTAGPEEALKLLLHLNNRFALDGSDPNSYGGILWCLGQFDRPFPPGRRITGTVRARSLARHAERLDLDRYEAVVQRNSGGRIAVIGAGMAGLTAAHALTDHGFDVTVFDKGRRPGGRMATRESRSGWSFDHGAQYFTARSSAFNARVAAWREAGVVAPWEGRIMSWEAGVLRPVSGKEPRWVAAPSMAALGGHLAEDLDLRSETRVVSLERSASGWHLGIEGETTGKSQFDLVVLALPEPQARVLAATADADSLVPAADMAPCWTVMVAFERPLALPFDGLFVNGGPLGWVARNGSKPGRPLGEAWVLQAGPDWSSAHLEDDAERVASRLLSEMEKVAGQRIPAPQWRAAHRWRYARGAVDGPDRAVFDTDAALGIAGDWLAGGRVEGAYQSGAALAGKILSIRELRRGGSDTGELPAQTELFA